MEEKGAGRMPSYDCFVTTRWTVVHEACRTGDPAGARAALESLCQTYWFPLYAYVRRRGYGPHDAEDCVQGFFERLIRLRSLAGTDREKGRFRAFLLAGINHYLADEWGHRVAAKRDVRKTIFLDALEAETRYALEPVDRLTPERLFDRQWAISLLESVVCRLRSEYAASGKEDLFAALSFGLTGDRAEGGYAALGDRLGLSEGALRVAVHRMRRRYRELLREEIARTLSEGESVEDELAELRRTLTE